MNSSLSHFKATLQRRKERTNKTKGRFKNHKEDFLDATRVKNEFNFPKPSKSKLARLKSEIKYRSKLRKRKEFVVFILILSILFSLLFLIN